MSLGSSEIVAIGEDMSKPDASAEFILKSLSQLRTGFKVKEDVIRTTKIGMIVSKFRQHKDAEVQKQSSALVKSWRQIVEEAKRKSAKGAGNGAVSANGNSNRTSPGSATPSSRPAATPPLSPPKSKVAPEKRDATSDNVDTRKTGSDVRDSCLKLMYNGLAFMSEDSSSAILDKAIAVERAAYTYLPPTDGEPSQAYKEKIRSLFQNLKNKSNPNLRVKVLEGQIEPERFVRMTSDELKSPERRAEDKQIEKENMDKAMVAKEEKSISSSLVCSKCRQKKVSYSQAQTRSADEPMTTFCECTNPVCGHRWKFS